MRSRMIGLAAALTMLTSAVPVPVGAAETAVLLDSSQFKIYDENLVYIGADYLNAADVLFDDQDKVPAAPDQTDVGSEKWEATDRSRNWKPNWQEEYGEDACFIDLGANYCVTGLCFLDTNGVQTWTVWDGAPYHWNEVTSFETDAYNCWRGITFGQPVETRYLRFTTPTGDSGISELAIYGYRISDLTAAQLKSAQPTPCKSTPTDLTAGQRIGFNAFIDDPMTAIMAGGNVREYHNFSWLYDDSGKVKFTQGTWGDMDAYYTALQKQHISIIPCFQGGSSYISGEKPPEIPVPAGADTRDPESYALHAQAFYQVAARYGSNQNVDPATLNVAEGSEPKIGMGLLDTLENSNEPNKTWSGKANYFSPDEMAAMCSADYDGHEGTIPNAGVKQADPAFKLAIGGLLTGANLIEYLDQMKLWFVEHRSDGQFAVDVLNVHMGCETCNPEDSTFVERIRTLQDWIDRNAPGMELWISEYEIPMGDCEVEGKDAHKDPHYQLRYAQRVMRTSLLAVGAGVDRITKFQLRDEGEGVYYNSGLTTGKGEWSKKEAWYDLACLTHTLRNADFIRDDSRDGVCDYVFRDRVTGEEIHAVWSPTSDSVTVEDFVLPTGGYSCAYRITPGMYAEGTTTALTVRDGSVTLDVFETPNFIRLTRSPLLLTEPMHQRITPVSYEAPLTNCFDEQGTFPDFLYGDTAGLTAPETNAGGSGLEGIVELEQPYILTGFGVYDIFGTGSLEIYDANTDTLLWSSDLGSYMSRSIDPTAPSVPTDRLRIVKGGGDLNEIALYGYSAPELTQMQYDVNNDGTFDVRDVVAMQKYLLLDGAVLANPLAGDGDADGVLDVFDLALMKRALTGGKS